MRGDLPAWLSPVVSVDASLTNTWGALPADDRAEALWAPHHHTTRSAARAREAEMIFRTRRRGVVGEPGVKAKNARQTARPVELLCTTTSSQPFWQQANSAETPSMRPRQGVPDLKRAKMPEMVPASAFLYGLPRVEEVEEDPVFTSSDDELPRHWTSAPMKPQPRSSVTATGVPKLTPQNDNRGRRSVSAPGDGEPAPSMTTKRQELQSATRLSVSSALGDGGPLGLAQAGAAAGGVRQFSPTGSPPMPVLVTAGGAPSPSVGPQAAGVAASSLSASLTAQLLHSQQSGPPRPPPPPCPACTCPPFPPRWTKLPALLMLMELSQMQLGGRS